MLVRVDVRDLKIELLQAANLRRRLGLDVGLAHATAQQIGDQRTECGAKSRRVCGASRIDQRGDFLSRHDRSPVDQHHMAADA